MQDAYSKRRVDEILSAVSLAGLIAGFRNYIDTYRNVIRHRGRYAAICLCPDPSAKLGSSIAIYLYGVILSFMVFFPLAQLHGISITRVHFVLQYLYWQVQVVLLVHLCAKALHGIGTFRDTIAVCCIFYGVHLPIAALLLSPIALYMPIGPDFFATVSTPPSPSEQTLLWLGIWFCLAMITGFVVWVALGLRWVSTVHAIKLRWLLLVLIGIGVPVQGLHNYFVAPLVGKGLRFASELIDSLL